MARHHQLLVRLERKLSERYQETLRHLFWQAPAGEYSKKLRLSFDKKVHELLGELPTSIEYVCTKTNKDITRAYAYFVIKFNTKQERTEGLLKLGGDGFFDVLDLDTHYEEDYK